MAKRTTHPTAKAAALSSKEQATKHPRIWAKGMEGTEAELESEAMAQYAEERRHHVRGFAFSDIPCRFFVEGDITERRRTWLKEQGLKPHPSDKRHTVSIKERWRNPEQWEGIRDYILEYLAGRDLIGRIPKGWSYAKLVGDRKPHRYDLSNPRMYALNGKLVPWDTPTGYVGKSYAATFEYMLKEAFRDAPANDKRAEVSAFLEHHRTKGGNPQALADLVDEILQRWKVKAPTYLDPLSWQRLVVTRHAHLLEAVEDWLKMARKAPTPSGDAPTFAALFGDRLPDVLRAMEDAGIQAVTGKGIGKVVGALHAACKCFERPLPPAHLWPAMLEQLFPQVKCSPKVQPVLSSRELEGRSAYAKAYRAIMDRLK